MGEELGEYSQKTQMQVIIKQNKMILDRLNIIMEMLSPKSISKMIEEDDEPEKEGELFGVPIEIYEEGFKNIPVPTDTIAEKGLPKTRITSPDIVGTATDKPKQQYTIYLLGEETDLAVKVKYNDIEAWLAKSALYGTYPNQLGKPIQMWIKGWIIKKNFTPGGDRIR